MVPKYRQKLPHRIAHPRHLNGCVLMALPAQKRLQRMLRRLPDENEFLPPHGTRAAPKFDQQRPFKFDAGGKNGKGIGASHQTGWTALVNRHIEELAKRK